MRHAMAILLIILAVGQALADTQPAIKVEATDRVDLGQMVRIRVSGSADMGTLVLRVRQHLPGEDADVDPSAILPLKVDGEYVFSVPTTGTFTIHASAYDPNTKSIVDAVSRVVIGNPDPKPQPEPKPTPPVVGTRMVYIVYESEAITNEQAMLLVSLRRQGSEFDAYMREKGHQLVILDKDLPAASAWANHFKQRGIQLPGVAIYDPTQNSDRAVLYSGKLPATASDLIYILQQHGG